MRADISYREFFSVIKMTGGYTEFKMTDEYTEWVKQRLMFCLTCYIYADKTLIIAQSYLILQVIFAKNR